MVIEETRDMAFVNSIIGQPDIWACVAPDWEPVFDLPYDPECLYFKANNGEGVIIFHPFLDGLKIHPNFPKKYRGKRANDAIEQSIQTLFSEGVRSIYAEIAVEFVHAIRLAKQLGFKVFTSPEWVTDRQLLVRHRLDS